MDTKETAALIIFILSIIWMHVWVIAKKDSRSNLSRIWLLDGLALAVVLLGYQYPRAYIALMEEDSIGEWVTFYAFALSGILIITHLWSSRKEEFRILSPVFLIPAAVAAFCLFVAGEEVSWGQRILAFKPPDLFLEQNYQQELNIHNLFKGDGLWGIQIESKHLVMLIAFVYGILFPLTTRFLPPLKKLSHLAPDLYLMPYFILVIAMEEIYPISLTGEACELYLGSIFLVHVSDTYPVRKEMRSKRRRKYGPFVSMLLILVLGTITAPLLSFLAYGSTEEAEATISEELQSLQRDFQNPETRKKKILRKKRVHKRLYNAIAQNYFHLPEDSLFLEGELSPADPGSGDIRRDRKGYFLDPWNNPYWVYYHRKEELVIFYSFGANRKRDSNLRRDLGLRGDDIGVVFETD